ncbi:MAG TPA: iron-sulfur cluster repair di-iron protein [Vicinamibacterales bacterium]
MSITTDRTVADIATTSPATIKVFQRHGIDFCCGGKVPLSEVCARKGLDVAAIVAELQAAELAPEERESWTDVPLHDLVGYIQERFHQPLRSELPRLSAMLARVVSRHGDRLPDTLLPLQATYQELERELLEHMAKEDGVLFPSIVTLEAEHAQGRPASRDWRWLAQPISVMEAEHATAGAALERMRAITGSYTPPEDACPTFRGLYFGLSELEREMHVHVHLENNVLFPRAARMAEVVVGAK